MKLTTIIAFLLVISNSIVANSVDSIQNDSDVVVFLKRIDKKFTSNKYRKLQVLPTDTIRQKLACNNIAEEWNIKNWEKADFNGDNKTDLIVTTFWYDFDVFVAIDKGDNTFQLIRLSKDAFQNCELGKPIKIKSEQLLLFYRLKYEYNEPAMNIGDFTLRSKIDTLIYKYGGFIEKQNTSASYKISEIEYHISSGWTGISPVFRLNIDNSQVATIEATSDNPKKNIPPTKANKIIVREIIDLIQYIHIKEAKSEYLVPWTDDTTIYLKVTFNDGTVKAIEDYGMIGTFGLTRLYELLFMLSSPKH
jgi:hypothetical protein